MQRLLLIIVGLLALHKAEGQVKPDWCPEIVQPVHNDKESVNTLIRSAYHYIFKTPHADSALYFIDAAKARLNNKCLEAAALILEAEVEGRLIGNPEKMEILATSALEIYKQSGNLRGKAAAFRIIALANILQGKDSFAEKNIIEALAISQSLKDQSGIGWAYFLKGFFYGKKGHNWESFENLVKSRTIGHNIKDDFLEAFSLFFIARTYNFSDDPRKAIEYYHKGLAINKTGLLLLWPHLEDLGLAYLKLNRIDSAIYYQQKQRSNIYLVTTDEKIRERFSHWMLPDFRLESKFEARQYSSVLNSILPGLPGLRKNKDKMLLMHSLFLAARAYYSLDENVKAGEINNELLAVARASSNRNFLEKAFLLQSKIYRKLKVNDSAWNYMEQHLSLKQEIAREQFNVRAAMYDASAENEKQLAVLNKDRKIQQQQIALQAKELERKTNLQRMLVAGIIGILLMTIVVIINVFLKRKNEQLENQQKQAALQQKSLELEMQALRAQMNPHFIFNCLSAIDTLIHTGNADKATVYLSRFARLIRLVMDSLKNNLVPFQKDLETMQLYLELEQFRCNNKFSYNLKADQDLVNGDYKVPPLIAQPFIENAIHHGLLNKTSESRILDVEASLEKGQIVYSIIDNGIGRRKAAILKQINKPEHQSYGIDITRERVSLHNKSALQTDVSITDLEEENGSPLGTKAVVRINSECYEA